MTLSKVLSGFLAGFAFQLDLRLGLDGKLPFCLNPAMTLKEYFSALIAKVQGSDEIQNNGKDKDGFYKPTRTVILQRLNMLKDLHANPNANKMVRQAWVEVVETLPPDWLIMSAEQKQEMKRLQIV